jgi:hypothetical protein
MDAKRRITESFASLSIFLTVLLLVSPAGSCASSAPRPPDPERDWTIMVYVNGKNSLEQDALNNFHGMAQVGSTSAINVVVELGRPASPTSDDGGWSGVYRFFVKKGTDPLPKDAITRVSDLGESEDMGSPATLDSFVTWATKQYPAKHLMLIIWNHGQGWRFQLAADKAARAAATRALLATSALADLRAKTPVLGGIKAISIDDDTGSILYNRDVEDVLEKHFDQHKPLDVLGFDACLMSMLETAYAFRTTSNIMIGSEDTELAEGWKYSVWLKALAAAPKSSPEAVAKFIVSSYKARYGDEYLTTLSAIHLNTVKTVAGQVSDFAANVIAAGQPELLAVKKSRLAFKSYGASVSPPLLTSVDLISLLKRYETTTSNAQLRAQSVKVRQSVQALIFENYASARSAKPPQRAPYGSEGVAIYFPESQAAFDKDPYKSGYVRSTTSGKPADKPVAFVEDTKWPDLVFAVLGTDAAAQKR